MKASAPSKLSQVYSNFLQHQTTVLDGEYFRLDNTLGVQNKSNLKGKICVLSRNYYAEKVEWLPITKRSDVLKVVKLKVKQQSQQTLYLLGTPVNGKTPVVYFYIKALPEGYSPWLILPETVVLALGVNQQNCQVASYKTPSAKTPVFFSTDLNCIRSAQQGGLINEPSQFAMSNGIHFESSTILDQQDYAKALSEGLQNLHRLNVAGFINKTTFISRSQENTWLNPVLIFGSVVISLYLVLGYAFSSWQAEQAKHELSLSMAKANQVLEQRNHIQQMVERVDTLQKQIPANNNDMDMWRVLTPLYEKGIIFVGIDKSGADIKLRIEAESASEALQLLLTQEGVANAEFNGTVRRQRNLESANIHFRLVQQGDQ